jgi:uncharacterized protein YjiS (DUF1127 family)
MTTLFDTLHHLLTPALTLWKLRRAHRRQLAQAVRQMEQLSERQLADIGLTQALVRPVLATGASSVAQAIAQLDRHGVDNIAERLAQLRDQYLSLLQKDVRILEDMGLTIGEIKERLEAVNNNLATARQVYAA